MNSIKEVALWYYSLIFTVEKVQQRKNESQNNSTQMEQKYSLFGGSDAFSTTKENCDVTANVTVAHLIRHWMIFLFTANIQLCERYSEDMRSVAELQIHCIFVLYNLRKCWSFIPPPTLTPVLTWEGQTVISTATGSNSLLPCGIGMFTFSWADL